MRESERERVRESWGEKLVLYVYLDLLKRLVLSSRSRERSGAMPVSIDECWAERGVERIWNRVR